MMTSIVIPQLPIIQLGLDLDFSDAAIYFFLKYYANADRCAKILIDGDSWFIPNVADIIEGLPLLNIRTAQGISKRINKLVKADVLQYHPANKKYVRFGKTAWKLEFSD